MSGIETALHAAQEAALRGSSELVDAAGGKLRVYDVVPEKASLPYLRFGDDTVLPLGPADDCLRGADVTSRVQIWAKPPVSATGPNQARAMGEIVRELLSNLTVPGHDVVVQTCEGASYLTDPDGSTHVILTFEYQTEPSA